MKSDAQLPKPADSDPFILKSDKWNRGAETFPLQEQLNARSVRLEQPTHDLESFKLENEGLRKQLWH
jgi:hypothetical protein